MRMREGKSVTAELNPRWTSCFRPTSEQSDKLEILGKGQVPNLFTLDWNS